MTNRRLVQWSCALRRWCVLLVHTTGPSSQCARRAPPQCPAVPVEGGVGGLGAHQGHLQMEGSMHRGPRPAPWWIRAVCLTQRDADTVG